MPSGEFIPLSHVNGVLPIFYPPRRPPPPPPPPLAPPLALLRLLLGPKGDCGPPPRRLLSCPPASTIVSPSFRPSRISVLTPSLPPVFTRRVSTSVLPSFLTATETVAPRVPSFTASDGTSTT